MQRKNLGIYRNFLPLFGRSTNIIPVQHCRACLQLQYAYSIDAKIKKKKVAVHNNMTIQELIKKMEIRIKPVIKLLKDYGYDTSRGKNTVLEMDITELIADEFGFIATQESKSTKVNSEAHLLLPRPPIVTIMGHVDHGKTTLLDYLRQTTVAANEAGGITQSIGAFSVQVPGLNDKVTFVDTPGHAAFNNMRARGAQLTDIVVLVVAADDGVMEQTMECIKHIKQAEVPMIIAINKIDKMNANIEKVKKELLRKGVQLEEFGGDVKCINISALKGENINDLLVLLNDFSKENNFTAAYEGDVEATVLEAENNKQKGILASVLVKQGKLEKGLTILAGNAFAKVRQLFDASNQMVKSAGPSDPVQILGWRSLPLPGDVAVQVKNEAEAKAILKLQEQEAKPMKIKQQPLSKAPGKKSLRQEFKSGRSKRIPFRVSLRTEAAGQSKENDNNVDGQKSLDIIIKSDVSGSLEALVNVITSFQSNDLKLNVMEAAVGNINESDINMADTFNGIIYCFNVTPPRDLLVKADQVNVTVRQYDIIYKLLDDLKIEIESKLPLQIKESIIGEADILKVFKLTGSRKGVVAGCRVTEGFLDNNDSNYLWRVVRDNQVVFEGSNKSLRRGSTDVNLVKKMIECGVQLNNFENFQENDQILCIKIDKNRQEIDWKL